MKILLVRPDRNTTDEKALATVGIDSITVPLLQMVQPADTGDATGLAVRMSRGGVLFLTSPRTWQAWANLVPDLEAHLARGIAAGLEIWTVGARTAASLPPVAAKVTRTGSGVSAADLLEEIGNLPPGVALLPQSALARPTLAMGLGLRGWQVRTAGVYSMVPVPDPALPDPGEVDGVLLRSPSAVRALTEHWAAGTVQVFAVGPSTTAEAEHLGWQPVTITRTAPDHVAEAIRATG